VHFPFGQYRYGRAVCVDTFRGENMLFYLADERHQRRCAGAHPAGKRRDIEIDAFLCVDAALAVQG
jgi:hypothetical protein